MIKTDVKEIGTHEYMVHVTVAQSEYDRIFSEQLKQLAGKVNLPGFRPGKTPLHHIKKQFAGKLHEDTVSQLLQHHFIAAVESSGLKPAAQPELAIPDVQPAEGFTFTMKVSTWPEVELCDLSTLTFDKTTVVVNDEDIDKVIERLMKSQVSYEVVADRAAEMGDRLQIDFVGSIDGEPFDGGKGEDVPIVLGEGRFIPGFEEQLVGSKADDEVTVNVTFPENYQAAHLAGKEASFAVVVRSVAKANHAEDEAALAEMLGFDSAEAMREDARVRLQQEADEGSFSTTQEAAYDAMLAAHPMELPAALIEQDEQEMTKRVIENMKLQGMPDLDKLVEDEEFKAEIHRRSVRGLKMSVLLQQVRDRGGLDVDDAELDAEIVRQSQQYPEAQRDEFKTWILSQKERMAEMKDALLERKCVDYIVEQANTNAVTIGLSEWQAARDND